MRLETSEFKELLKIGKDLDEENKCMVKVFAYLLDSQSISIAYIAGYPSPTAVEQEKIGN